MIGEITLYENDFIKAIEVTDYEEYSIRYIIESKKEFEIEVYLKGMDDYIIIEPFGSIALFEGDYSEDMIRCIKEENATYKEV